MLTNIIKGVILLSSKEHQNKFKPRKAVSIMKKFRIVTEEGKQIITSETYAGCERYWNACNGIYEDEDGKHYIYIEEMAEENKDIENKEEKKNTVKLQGISGQQEGTEAKNLKTGDVIVWNYGMKSEVVEINPSKTGKTIIFMLRSYHDGKTRSRKMRAGTLVVVDKNKKKEPEKTIKKSVNHNLKHQTTDKGAERELKAEETKAKERTYYPINEETARLAKEMNSFTEYKKGTVTEEYRQYCNKAYDILDKIRAEKPEHAGQAENKIDYYCRKLAEYYNDYYRNEASCPSVLISGAGNFPYRKKERQNSRRETLRKTWEYLENYLCKIEDILYSKQPVKLSDSDAIEKLTTKIQQLEKEHKMHMSCNAYCKKNGTLKGFSGLGELEEKEVAYIENSLKKSPAFMPFITYNETANIRRYKERLAKLIKEKEAGTTEQAETDAENNKLFTAVENKEIMRLQILFDGIPPVSVRDILKSNGFKWSRKNKAWQRQLTDNARYVYQNIKDKLKSAMVA